MRQGLEGIRPLLKEGKGPQKRSGVCIQAYVDLRLESTKPDGDFEEDSTAEYDTEGYGSETLYQATFMLLVDIPRPSSYGLLVRLARGSTFVGCETISEILDYDLLVGRTSRGDADAEFEVMDDGWE